MSEFALGDPVSSASGPARNPWDLERSPGTSSTGSGAATAARLCATSLGEDTVGPSGPQRPLRSGGSTAHLGTGQPIRGGRGQLVHRHYRPHLAHGRGLRAHHRRYRRLRSQGPLHPPGAVPNYRQALTGDIKGLKVGLVREFLDAGQSGG